MCFSASTGIDSLSVNGLVLPMKAFTMLLDHLALYFSAKEKQRVNVTTPIIVRMQQKYIKNAPVELVPLECTTSQRLKGHFPCDPSSTLYSGRWPLSCSFRYKLIEKEKLWMHFHNYFPYHAFRHTYVPIRTIRVPWSATTSTLRP
jgi:hypothetical protein